MQLSGKLVTNSFVSLIFNIEFDSNEADELDDADESDDIVEFEADNDDSLSLNLK